MGSRRCRNSRSCLHFDGQSFLQISSGLTHIFTTTWHNVYCHVSSLILDELQPIIGLCSIITVIGFLDSTVAAKQNGDRFGHPISPNRELVALGAANLAGSFVPGTLPAFGSIVRFVQSQSIYVCMYKSSLKNRSRINGDIGARTQLASLITAGIVLLATFFLLPALYSLPICVLASMFVFFAPHNMVHSDASLQAYVCSSCPSLQRFRMT